MRGGTLDVDTSEAAQQPFDPAQPKTKADNPTTFMDLFVAWFLAVLFGLVAFMLVGFWFERTLGDSLIRHSVAILVAIFVYDGLKRFFVGLFSGFKENPQIRW